MDASFKLGDSSDTDVLAKLMQEYYDFDHLTFDDHVARAALRQILSDDSLGRVWLIQQGEDAVGYIVLTLGFSLEFQGRDAFIDELYIRESYRHGGIGTKALKFVEEVCRSLGVQALHLEVERANVNAQKFYRKSGFADHARYLMTKWISS